MFEFAEKIWSAFQAGHVWLVCLFVFAGSIVLLSSALTKALIKYDLDRKRIQTWLREDTAYHRYRLWLQTLLDRIQHGIETQDYFRAKTELGTAFAPGLLQITMLVAVAYPIFMLLGQWMVGSPMVLGRVELAPSGTGWQRAIAVIGFGLPVIFFTFAIRATPRWRLLLLICAIGLCFGSLWLLNQINIPRTVIDTCVIAFGIIGTGALAVTGAFASLGAFFGKGAFAITVAVAFAGVIAYAVSGTGVVAVTASSLGAIITEILSMKLAKRRLNPGLVWIGYSILWLVLLAIALRFVPVDALPEARARLIILFIGVFPLINGIADFISTGATRYFLRQVASNDRSPLLNIALDICVGGLAFLALGASLITAVHLLRFGDGSALLDLGALFADLLQGGAHYGWLFFMMASTLLPTLLHFVLALFATLITAPHGLRHWIADRIGESDAGLTGVGAGALVLSGLLALSATLVVWAAMLIYHYDHQLVARAMIQIFYWFARSIGAVDGTPVSIGVDPSSGQWLPIDV